MHDTVLVMQKFSSSLKDKVDKFDPLSETRHIPHFMKIEIRPNIGIIIVCGSEKWKRSVAWFPSYGVKCIADAEHNFMRSAMLLR